MSGYTPLFSSLTTGTLCGRWPDIGLWPIVLSLADRDGIVDVTPQFISGVTGLPVEEVVACMGRFCKPDPYSRSNAADGARLELLDEHREWGWRVVNHSLYREKARLKAKNEREVREGLNAQRMNDRRRPPVTAADPLSNTNTNTNLKKEVPSEPVPQERDETPVERVFEHWRSEFRHPKAVLDPKRRRAIQRALEHYDEPTLCQSISGYKLSPHHMGQNEQRTVYDDISLFLRGSEHIERGLNFARAPPVAAKSAVEVARENLRKHVNGSRVVSEQSGSSDGSLGQVVGVLR